MPLFFDAWQQAISHLGDHCASRVSHTTLARVADMPVRSFRRAFKQATGCAPRGN